MSHQFVESDRLFDNLGRRKRPGNHVVLDGNAFDFLQTLRLGVVPADHFFRVLVALSRVLNDLLDLIRLGLQLAAPVVVFSLVFNIAAGLVGRVMPQFQVFFVVTPLIVLLGLSIFALSLGVIGMVWLGVLRFRHAMGHAYKVFAVEVDHLLRESFHRTPR